MYVHVHFVMICYYYYIIYYIILHLLWNFSGYANSRGARAHVPTAWRRHWLQHFCSI